MEIKKGYTLSQFVDYLDLNPDIRDQVELCVKYNNFLKQLLAKEMFSNPAIKPMKGIYDDSQRKKWQEAEKKVIFKNVKIQNRITGEQDVFASGFFVARIRHDKSWSFVNSTLHAQAEATNGELSIKNVTI